jgi:replicative DNA helicase
VVIDTIDMVPARYAKNDELQKQGYITAELKKIAMEQDVIILAVSHISKGASYRIAEGQALDIHSGKGNSALEQKADKIIAFEGDRDKNKIWLSTIIVESHITTYWR